jgi:hypothetical protein
MKLLHPFAFRSLAVLCLFAHLFIWQVASYGNAEDQRSQALESLLTARETLQAEVESLRSDLAVAGSKVEAERIEAGLAERADQLEELNRRFRESVSGISPELFEEAEKEPFSWEQTLGKILEPILEEVEKATATSRKRSDLLGEKEKYEERAAASEAALERVETLLAGSPAGGLGEALAKEKAHWEERLLIAENRAQAAALQLQELEAQSEGVVGETTSFVRGFLAERGLNLLIGIFSALLVFFGLRVLLMLIQRVRPSGGSDSFGSRIFLLLTNLLSIVGAVIALLIAFSAAGDLFLLGIVLVFLIGAAWAGIQVIPQFIESLKIILNIGMVREGQRLVFDGVPWNVDQLGFSCQLGNQELDEAMLVLPARRLVGLHSRPWCSDEELFPCRRGDWVELGDGTTGSIVRQNPDVVTLREWGGSVVTIPTAEFLLRSPRNLSREGFELRFLFGIDYQHQEVATNEVAAWFEEAVRAGLEGVVEADQLRRLDVRFEQASASSLDFAIEAGLGPGAAQERRKLRGLLQRCLVDACRQRGLVIPFTQVTVHQG